MSRLISKAITFSVIAFTAALLCGACSHDQRLTKIETPSVAPAGEPHKTPRLAPVQPEVAVAPKEPDDQAIFFDFDSALLRAETRPVLQKLASAVRDKDKEDVRVEGNCDELGTVEYNLALGDHRARVAKDYLVHLGLPPSRIQVVSYGSQRPKFPGHDDDDRAKKRRDDFVLR